MVSAVGGAVLAAPTLVAFVDYLRSGATLGGHTGAYSTLALHGSSSAMMLAPYSLGGIFQYLGYEHGGTDLVDNWRTVGGYFGVSLVVLALIGLQSRRWRGLRAWSIAWIAVSAAKMFALAGVLEAVNLLPGMKQVAFYRYVNPAMSMALIVLAVLAVDDLVRRAVRLRAVAVAGIVTAALLYVARREALPVVRRVEAGGGGGIGRYYHYSFLAAGLILVVVVAAAVLARVGTLRIVAGLAVAVVVGVEAVGAFAVPSLSAPTTWRTDAPLVAFLRGLAHASATGTDLGRVYAPGGAPGTNYGAYYGVPLLDANDLPFPNRWTDYVRTRLEPDFNGTDFGNLGVRSGMSSFVQHVAGYRDAGVEYVILPSRYRLGTGLVALLTPIRTTDRSTIYRLSGAKPYAAAADCTLRAHSRTSFTADCPHGGLLVRRELDMPGWRASVGGRDVPIELFDGTFQAVRLPAGTSRVSFDFVPPLGRAAVWVSGLSLVGLAGWGAGALGRRRRGQDRGRTIREPSGGP